MNTARDIHLLNDAHNQATTIIRKLEDQVDDMQKSIAITSTKKERSDLRELRDILQEARLKERELSQKINELLLYKPEKKTSLASKIFKSIFITLTTLAAKNQFHTDILGPIQHLKHRIEATKTQIKLVIVLNRLHSVLLISSVVVLAMTIVLHIDRAGGSIDQIYIVPGVLFFLYAILLTVAYFVLKKNKEDSIY